MVSFTVLNETYIYSILFTYQILFYLFFGLIYVDLLSTFISGTETHCLDLPDQCLLSHVLSLTLKLAPLHCAEVLCYLAKGNLESLQVSLSCPREVFIVVLK